MPSNGERLLHCRKCAASGANKGRGRADSIHKNCLRYFCTGNKVDQAVLGRVEHISRRSQPSAWHAIVHLGTTTFRQAVQSGKSDQDSERDQKNEQEVEFLARW